MALIFTCHKCAGGRIFEDYKGLLRHRKIHHTDEYDEEGKPTFPGWSDEERSVVERRENDEV
jgi:hypothetical protein